METVKWQIDKRVMFVSIEGEQDQKGFNWMNDEMFRLLDEGQPPIHLIIDLSKLVKPYVDISLITKKTVAADKRVGHIVIIGARGTVQFVVNVVGAIIKSKLHNVLSVEDALRMLKEIDSSIPSTV